MRISYGDSSGFGFSWPLGVSQHGGGRAGRRAGAAGAGHRGRGACVVALVPGICDEVPRLGMEGLIYICLCVYTYVNIYVYTYSVCIYICVCLFMYLFIYVYIYIFIYVYIYIYIHTYI